MSREPYESEQPRALLYHLRTNRHWLSEDSVNGQVVLAGVYNDASCPWLYRTDSEHHQCVRIARLCRRLAKHLRYSFDEWSNGAWKVRSIKTI